MNFEIKFDEMNNVKSDEGMIFYLKKKKKKLSLLVSDNKIITPKFTNQVNCVLFFFFAIFGHFPKEKIINLIKGRLRDYLDTSI